MSNKILTGVILQESTMLVIVSTPGTTLVKFIKFWQSNRVSVEVWNMSVCHRGERIPDVLQTRMVCRDPDSADITEA